MNKKPDGYIPSISINTNCTSKEDVAAEVSALKLAVALIYRRLPKKDQENILLEMRQINSEVINRVAEQLEQFKFN
ncbi:hypothetical protein GHU01_03755 [Proteus mirabilis]|nr:hypothetical protein [Proteus mirabilis]